MHTRLERDGSAGSARALVAVVVGALGLLPALVAPAAAQDAMRGADLYARLDCAECHAVNATGDFGPQLAGTGLSLEAVTRQLRAPSGLMPTFGADRLGDEEIADIYAWLQTLPPERPFPSWFSTDLINLPTPALPRERTLEIHFTHRFSTSVADAGLQGLWGLDSFAFPAFWFAYGIRDWFQVHGGRSSNLGTWEYGAKVQLLAEDRLQIPISAAAVVSGAYIDGDGILDKSRFVAEFPVGWRVHDRFSVMAAPLLATNTDESGNPTSDNYSAAIGFGGTFRFTPGQSIDVEWVTNIGGFVRPENVDQWQVFWGIKVGGHVFQIGVTNTILYTGDQMAPGAQQTGDKSDVRIGFNLVREFKIGGG